MDWDSIFVQIAKTHDEHNILWLKLEKLTLPGSKPPTKIHRLVSKLFQALGDIENHLRELKGQRHMTLQDAMGAGVIAAFEVRQNLLDRGFSDPETAPWPGILATYAAHGQDQPALSDKEMERAHEIVKDLK